MWLWCWCVCVWACLRPVAPRVLVVCPLRAFPVGVCAAPGPGPCAFTGTSAVQLWWPLAVLAGAAQANQWLLQKTRNTGPRDGAAPAGRVLGCPASWRLWAAPEEGLSGATR